MDSLLGFTHTLRTSTDPTVCVCIFYQHSLSGSVHVSIAAVPLRSSVYQTADQSSTKNSRTSNRVCVSDCPQELSCKVVCVHTFTHKMRKYLNSCVCRFLPHLTREALSKALKDTGILPLSSSLPQTPIECKIMWLHYSQEAV